MLLHIEYAHAGIGPWRSVHHWAAAMTREPVAAGPDVCGLFRGAPAVAYALRAAGQPAYARALDTLDGHIATLTRLRLQAAHRRIDRGRAPSLREFDLMRGLTGLGAYLLQGDHHELLRAVLAYLIRLTAPVTIGGERFPGWWTSHGPDDRSSPRWPGGHGNLGMAHGIAGPLALLSLARLEGITVPGHADAIQRICAFLDRWRRNDGSRVWWPGLISFGDWKCRAVEHVGPQRPSWCYGTPGLARAQQLAGMALWDTRRQRDAEHALASCVADDAQLAQITDASLCHGWAGLLQTTWRAAQDAGTHSPLATLVPNLRTHIDHYRRTHATPAHRGLLEGRAGIQLARHTTAGTTLPKSGWDACLLLDVNDPRRRP